MLTYIRKKQVQVQKQSYLSLLRKLYNYYPSALNLYLGNLVASRRANSTFRFIGKDIPCPAEKTTVKGESFNMLECPAGYFIWGEPPSHKAKTQYETTLGLLQREIKADDSSLEYQPYSFLLGETEVTQGLYAAVVGTNPSSFQASSKHHIEKALYPFSSEHPVDSVSWEEAIYFCNKLSELEGFDTCYSRRDVLNVGVIRPAKPTNSKDLKRYDAFYEVVSELIKGSISNFALEGLRIDVSYDGDPLSYDVLVVDQENHDLLQNLGFRGMFNLSTDAGANPYLLNKAQKEKLNSFIESESARRFYTCDFTKGGYRLPTEWEWEYAAKAGTNSRWSGTDDEATLKDYATFKQNQKYDTSHPVKIKKPNAWGFYDMSGNVWEWCWDFYDERDKSRRGSTHVRRGGAWHESSIDSTTTYREGANQVKSWGGSINDRYTNTGFRICRTIVS